MMKNIMCAGLFMMAAGAAYADMYAALQNVYDTNPIIAEQRAALNAATAELDLARTGYKPYLGISANAGVARSNAFDHTFDTTPTQIGVAFEQPVFKGGATVAKIKAAKGVIASQQAALYSTQQDVFLQAIRAYIDVLNADEVLKLKQNNQRVLQEYYDLYRQKKDVGVLTETDVAQASARLEGAKYQTIEARAEYDNALETFRRIYGMTDEKYMEINVSRMDGLFPASVEGAEEYALSHHPVILALQSQEAAARENITVARQSRMPSIDIRGSAMQVDDMPVLDRVRDGRVGIYLSMPLYDKGNASANVDKVRFTVAGIQEQQVAARRMIRERLHQAWNLYQAQAGAIDAAKSAVKASRMALDGVKEQQQNGRRTVLDVLNAEQEVLNSEVSLVRARHGKVAAYFAVLAATGRLSAEALGINTEK